MQTKSQALSSASWRPGKASGAVQCKPKAWTPGKLVAHDPESEGPRTRCSDVRMRAGGDGPLRWEGTELVPPPPFCSGLGDAHRIREGRPSLLHQLNQMLVSPLNTDTPESVKVGRPKSVSRQKCVLVIQLCPTLCFPMDCSLPGSSTHGILQARILEWAAIPFSRDLLDPGIKLRSPALRTDSLPTEPPGKLKKRKKEKKLTKRSLAKKDAVSIAIKINF